MMVSAVVMALSGCATTQSTQFYLLTPMARETVPDQPEGHPENRSLGIGPITIPEYLNRPQIVTRAGNNSLSLAEFHQWAENLDHNIAQVMAENLSLLLATDLIEIFPWHRRSSIDYQLAMDLLQFDRNPDGTATLLARWSLLDGKGHPLAAGKKSLITVEPTGRDYDSLVKALSETLAGLSREVAAAITASPTEQQGE